MMEVDESGWMMSDVMEVSRDSSTVLIVDSALVTVGIPKMLVSAVLKVNILILASFEFPSLPVLLVLQAKNLGRPEKKSTVTPI